MKNIKVQKQTKNMNLKLFFYPKRFLITVAIVIVLLILWKVVF